MNISIFLVFNILVFNFKRKKICFMGKLNKIIYFYVIKKYYIFEILVNKFLKIWNIYYVFFFLYGWIIWNIIYRVIVCFYFILVIFVVFYSGYILNWYY